MLKKNILMIFVVSILMSIVVLQSPEVKANSVSIDRNQYLHNFYQIPLEAGREIFTTENEKLKRNAYFSGILLITFLLDQKIRDFAQENIYQGSNILSNFLYDVGTQEVALWTFGSFYAWSKLSGNQYLEDTIFLSFQSLLLTQVLTEALKNSVNRIRPTNSPDNPFVRGSGNSFISGHASGTWSVATIAAGRYPEIKEVSYGLAAAVALARIYEDAHWASDIFAGSVAGYGIGRLTLRLNENINDQLSLIPVLTSEQAGLQASIQF